MGTYVIQKARRLFEYLNNHRTEPLPEYFVTVTERKSEYCKSPEHKEKLVLEKNYTLRIRSLKRKSTKGYLLNFSYCPACNSYQISKGEVKAWSYYCYGDYSGLRILSTSSEDFKITERSKEEKIRDEKLRRIQTELAQKRKEKQERERLEQLEYQKINKESARKTREYIKEIHKKNPKVNINESDEDKYKRYYILDKLKTASEQSSAEDVVTEKTVKDRTDNRVNFLVRSSMKDCIREGHDYYPVRAKTGMLIDSEQVDIIFDACYCKDCSAYFIKDDTLGTLQSKGKLLCPVISRKAMQSQDSLNNTGLSLKSKLALAGYTVNASDNYKSSYREGILSNLIESGVCTRDEVIKLLKFFIKAHAGQHSMEKAVSKWKDDLNFVESLDIDKIKEIRKIITIEEL